jgi:hypothetical protein
MAKEIASMDTRIHYLYLIGGYPDDRSHRNVLGINIANGKPVILGEVGWPSAGKPDNETAVSTVENERIYTTDMIIAVKAGQIRSIFLFEAFDGLGSAAINGNRTGGSATRMGPRSSRSKPPSGTTAGRFSFRHTRCVSEISKIQEGRTH